jgi:hypothetical protein
MIDLEKPGVHKFGDVATLLYSHDELLIPERANPVSIYFPNGSLPFDTETELTQQELQAAADFIRGSDVSMRSSVIQKGNDFKNGRNYDFREFIANNLQIVRIKLPNGTIFNGLESQVEIVNLTQRMYQLPQGTGLFRFYQLNTPSIEGDELDSLISNKVKISGEWEYATGYDTNGQKIHKGVFLPIGDKRWMIKPNKRFESPTVIPKKRPPRVEIDQVFTPLKELREQTFWVGETPHVILDPSIDMVLDSNAFHSTSEDIHWRKVWEHVRSPLVDGGSDWRVRVEIYSPTKRRRIPNFVLATFYRNNSLDIKVTRVHT